MPPQLLAGERLTIPKLEVRNMEVSPIVEGIPTIELETKDGQSIGDHPTPTQ